MNLKIFGRHDDATVKQMYTCLAIGGQKAVLCADGHKGYAQPIGGVIAYKDLISISGVGFDIACGNLALRTDACLGDVRPKIEKIMNDIVENISFGMGRHNKNSVDHELFDAPAWDIDPMKSLKKTAQDQLGTVGSGNHYVDIFTDEEKRIWIGVHFGSRGLGHKTATYFLNKAGGKDGMDVAPAVVKLESNLAQDYLTGMHLAGRYAYAGREYVARYVAKKILRAKIKEEVHNHHNFAWLETHKLHSDSSDEKYWVVRKGATPAFPGQKGFIGGSMGDDAVIIEGVDSETSRDALFSTVHGAGRIMSRTKAKGKPKRIGKDRFREGGCISPGDMRRWLKKRGVVLRGGDVDEAPQAYRRLPEVLKAHEGTIKVLHTLSPIGVAMAGPKIYDPYKD
ncbi:MAG: RtcB family protein [Verrucomicrobiota bacterium]